MSETGIGPSNLLWRQGGAPASRRFEDIYFSLENGLAEARHVFLEGTDLQNAWAGRRSFAIGETGFGTGLNFLASWALWRAKGPADGHLHYVSVEGFPMAPAQLAKAHEPFPELKALSARLTATLGSPLPGFHRFHFDDDRVHLTLLHGEVVPMLSALDATIDAWFLDGFAPSRNAAMWTPAVFAEIARLTAPGGRLATFTVAGAVRRGLSDVGFDLARRPGFGRKKEMLTARYDPRGDAGKKRGAMDGPKTALVVGAGIAGTSVAMALRRRGVAVTLADQAGAPAQGASGNDAGLVMPRLTRDRTPAGRLHGAAFAYTTRQMHAGDWVGAHAGGVVQLATSTAEWVRFKGLTLGEALPRSLMRAVGRCEAEALLGTRVQRPGLYFPTAGAMLPRSLIERALADIPLRADRIVFDADGLPQRSGESATLEADLVIAAHGLGLGDLPQGHRYGLRASRGQLLIAEGAADRPFLQRAVTFGGYVAPGPDHSLVLGSTYTPVSRECLSDKVDPRAGDTRKILYDTRRFMPDLESHLEGRAIRARAALRATTPDHLPLAGPAPRFDRLESWSSALRTGSEPTPFFDLSKDYFPRLHVLAGLGSRGFTTAPLLAEWLVSTLFDEPSPLERDLADSLHPARFFVRAMRRGEA